MRASFSTRPARSAAPGLGRTTASVFADLARKTKYVDPALAERWPALAGEKLAALSRPGRLTGRGQGKTLELRVSSGAAAAAVQMETDGLIARVNAYLGPGTVSRIAVIQSGGAARAAAPAPPAGDPAPPDDAGLSSALASFRAAVNRRNSGK